MSILKRSLASWTHMRTVLEAAYRSLARHRAMLAIAAAYLIFVLILRPQFASVHNLQDIVENALPLALLAIGQTLVLVVAGIDLSITSIVCAASVVGAWQLTGVESGMPPGVPVLIAIASMLLVGMAVGFVNGFAIANLDVPPFMATLITMISLGGSVQWLTASASISPLPDAYLHLVLGPSPDVPLALLWTGLAVIGAQLVLSRTIWGRWLFAVGLNPRTALVSGLPTRRILIAAYVCSGLFAGLAAVLYTARLENGSGSLIRREIVLDSIAAAVIGGASLTGGRGSAVGPCLGALFMAALSKTLDLFSLDISHVMLAKGAVILVAAAVDARRSPT